MPELRPFIGRNVRITVVDETEADAALLRASAEFWNPPSLEELARRQGVVPATETSHYGSFTAEDFEGFDEWLAETRRSGGRGQ